MAQTHILGIHHPTKKLNPTQSPTKHPQVSLHRLSISSPRQQTPGIRNPIWQSRSVRTCLHGSSHFAPDISATKTNLAAQTSPLTFPNPSSILWTDRTFLGSYLSQNITIPSNLTTYPFQFDYSLALAPPAVANTDSWTVTVQFGGATIDNFVLAAAAGDGIWYNRTAVIGGVVAGANELFVSFVYSGYDTPYNEAWLELDNLELSYNTTNTIS